MSSVEKGLFHYVTSGSYVARHVEKRITCTITRATLAYQQIDNGNITNQIHGFTIDYGKFTLIPVSHKYYTLRGSYKVLKTDEFGGLIIL